MIRTDYNLMYEKIFKILGDKTPIKADCGKLCEGACCKGDENTGMLLFPYEQTPLSVKQTQNGQRLAVCDGSCDRSQRPLSCRIFPFFPAVDQKGRVYVELDIRAKRLCPLVDHADEVMFDKSFLRAVKRVGKILAKDKTCVEFLKNVTEQIDTYATFI